MCLFFKRENLDTGTHIGRAPFEDEGRVWSDGSKSQDAKDGQQATSSWGEEAWTGFLLTALRSAQF